MRTQIAPNITFSFQTPVSLAGRIRLKDHLRSIFKKEGRSLEDLTIVFCTDAFLLDINRRYLNHDFLTDIITFDLSDAHASLAEIYISVERVRENATVFKVPLRSELLRVIFHGVLHLSGYRDKKPVDQKVMRAREDFYLEHFFSK